MGPDAGKSGLKVGDRVAMEPGVSCRVCVMCKTGKYEVSLFVLKTRARGLEQVLRASCAQTCRSLLLRQSSTGPSLDIVSSGSPIPPPHTANGSTAKAQTSCRQIYVTPSPNQSAWKTER